MKRSVTSRVRGGRQAAGERHGQAVTLLFLGRVYRRIGNIEDARRCWGNAQAIFEDLGDEVRRQKSVWS